MILHLELSREVGECGEILDIRGLLCLSDGGGVDNELSARAL